MASKRPLDIEYILHWTYARQLAGQGGAVTRLGYPGRSAFTSISVDCQASISSTAVHPDAELVHEHVVGLPDQSRHLVVGHAKATTRPDWYEQGARLGPVWNARGRPTVEYDHNRRPVLCQVRSVVSIETVRQARQAYAVWHQALVDLVDALDGQLVSLVPLPPQCPAAPWQRDAVVDRRAARSPKLP